MVTTPTRLADELRRIALAMSKLAVDVACATVCVGRGRANEFHRHCQAAVGELVDLRSAVLTGRLPVVADLVGRSPAPADRPILDVIEANRKPLFDGLETIPPVSETVAAVSETIPATLPTAARAGEDSDRDRAKCRVCGRLEDPPAVVMVEDGVCAHCFDRRQAAAEEIERSGPATAPRNGLVELADGEAEEEYTGNRSGRYRERNRNDFREELRPLMDDPNVNDSGVYDRPEKIDVAMKPSWNCRLTIDVAKCTDGGWREGFHAGAGTSSREGLPSITDAPYGTRFEAIRAAAERAIKWFRAQYERPDTLKSVKAAAAADAVFQFIQALPPEPAFELVDDQAEEEESADEPAPAIPQPVHAEERAALDDCLYDALRHDDTERTRGRWKTMAAEGATNEQIREAIQRSFGTGGQCSGTLDGVGYTYRGGSKPAFWYGWHRSRDTKSGEGTPPPTLLGLALTDRVREIFEIPASTMLAADSDAAAAEELDEPASIDTGPKFWGYDTRKTPHKTLGAFRAATAKAAWARAVTLWPDLDPTKIDLVGEDEAARELLAAGRRAYALGTDVADPIAPHLDRVERFADGETEAKRARKRDVDAKYQKRKRDARLLAKAIGNPVESSSAPADRRTKPADLAALRAELDNPVTARNRAERLESRPADPEPANGRRKRSEVGL